MKKNITINLCGRLYQIDEDAYELLSHYTDTLRDYFKKQEGGEETANDIEERIAELFDDLKAKGIEAIAIEHVQGVIEQIGKVEEIAGEETKFPENTTSSANVEAKKPLNTKKFFRDSQNKILAGVLAGCAHFYGGTADGWRWGFVILCVLWFCFLGFSPFAFTLPFEGVLGSFLGILALPFFFLSIPFTVLPLFAYLLVAIFSPATKTAEDVLLMKGKEVNPQTLTKEVQEATLSKEKKKDDITLGEIFIGVICIGLSTVLTIGFIVALCFFVAFVAASGTMADTWWNIDRPEDLNAIFIPAILSGILLLTSIGILLYCSVHAAVSSFGKTPAMKTRHRVIWFLLWVASVVGFVGCTVWAVGELAETQTARWKKEGRRTDGIEVTITDELGHPFNEVEYDFFKENDWELITAENTDRYTYSGEYMTGDESVRYLDDCNDDTPLIYTARKQENDVEPGYYRLSAVVKANNKNKFIYLYGITIDEQTNDSVIFTDQVQEIPNDGLKGGNIWEWLKSEELGYAYSSLHDMDDPVLKELVGCLPERDKRRILGANDGKGYGWNFIYIDSIKVDNPHNAIFYGVTTDQSITGKPATKGWFSATDFKLEKIQ